MDAALLYSLLEANCSLALAEELLLDGWGLPLDPEGRRRRAERAARGSFPGVLSAPQAPRSERPAPPATYRSPSPLSPVSRSRLLLQHHLGPDRDVLAPERRRSPGGEAVP